MKSERRHALQTNQLADTLGHQLEETGHYWKWLVGGLLAVFAAIALYLALSHQRQTAADRAWLPLIDAQAKVSTLRDAAPLLKVAGEAPGQPVALLAEQMAGDTELQAGLRIMFRNRSEADTHFTKAVESFTKVAEKAQQAELKQMALLSLAAAHEALRDTKNAAAAYDRAEQAAPKSVLAEAARQRQARLKKEGAFYEWFAAYKPPSPHSTTPLPGTGDFDLKKELEKLQGEKLEGPSEKTPGSESPSTEKTGEKPAAESPPAEKSAEKSGETPAEKTPEGDKPAAEKPAAEQPGVVEPPASPAPEAPQPDGTAPAAK